MKLNTKYYNTTDLNPESTFTKHVFHRDQFAHYLRWTHILKEARIGETICDFGCGNGNLLEVFVVFIRDEVVYPNMGIKQGKRFLPLILTFFFQPIFRDYSIIVPETILVTPFSIRRLSTFT